MAPTLPDSPVTLSLNTALWAQMRELQFNNFEVAFDRAVAALDATRADPYALLTWAVLRLDDGTTYTGRLGHGCIDWKRRGPDDEQYMPWADPRDAVHHLIAAE